ncbi:MAG: T9SS type A sorting domain-containing protein, partial [Flavobacteriales bacterium]
TYQWDANTGNQTTSTATGLLAGTYLVTITDDNGCTKEDSISITSPQPINSTVNSVSLLCNGDSNGTATAINSGGVSPYSYQWDGNAGSQTTATATGLQVGTYYITITDMNGCTAVDSITITQPQVLTVSIATTDDNGGCTGSATATVGGGTSPYAYQWDDSNNQTDQTATGLCAGLYCVTVTDSNACTVFSCDSVIVGIAHLEKSGGFTVYPNPGSGQLTLLNSSSVDYDALVMDVSGRVLMIVRDVHSRTTHLDLSSFGKGVYLIAIKEQDGRSEVLLYVLE